MGISRNLYPFVLAQMDKFGVSQQLHITYLFGSALSSESTQKLYGYVLMRVSENNIDNKKKYNESKIAAVQILN